MGDSSLPFGIDRSLLRLDSQDPYFCLHFIMIFVRDQERSLRFYVDQLGFRLVVDQRFESGGRWIEIAPPDGNASLSLALGDPRLRGIQTHWARYRDLLYHRGCQCQVQGMERSWSTLSLSTTGTGMGRNLHTI
ncbi:MAG: hypothetical protein AUF67_04065 [Acidobacteria bacterium 13_1_20CM_58_21]|nr:MAG: hypothetical protein AUF67_04065 [Acidobacteria bacterium 13_1_20CM_58_21]